MLENCMTLPESARVQSAGLSSNYLALLEGGIHTQDDGIGEGACCEGLDAMSHFRHGS